MLKCCMVLVFDQFNGAVVKVNDNFTTCSTSLLQMASFCSTVP